MSNERKPLSKVALSGLVLGAVAIVAIVASGPGYRIGWRHFTVGLRVSEWAAYGASDGGAQVDVRSRSRIGRTDRGVNAKRIRAFLAVLHDRAAQARR